MNIINKGGVSIPLCQITPKSSLDFVWKYFDTGAKEKLRGKTNHRFGREKVEKLERVCSSKGQVVIRKEIRIV